jgi:hypothetical protein
MQMRTGGDLMRIIIATGIAIMLALGAGCAADGQPWQGQVLEGSRLHLASPDEGVYPDRSVLADPNNPFALGAIGDTTIWDIQKNGDNVASFYAWATACARGATGERQYYAALDLKAVYEAALADDAELPEVRARAIRGFQSMLDHFPDAVTYDATGTITYDLATPCVQSILDLGGKVQGGWVLVPRDGGGQMAVRRAGM